MQHRWISRDKKNGAGLRLIETIPFRHPFDMLLKFDFNLTIARRQIAIL
jgi:hypothetical protein